MVGRHHGHPITEFRIKQFSSRNIWIEFEDRNGAGAMCSEKYVSQTKKHELLWKDKPQYQGPDPALWFSHSPNTEFL